MTNSGLIQGKSPTAQNAEPWQCLCSHPSSQQLPLGQQTSPSHQVLPFSEVGIAGNHLLELIRRSWAVLSWSWGGGRTGPAVPALSPAPNFQLFLLHHSVHGATKESINPLDLTITRLSIRKAWRIHLLLVTCPWVHKGRRKGLSSLGECRSARVYSGFLLCWLQRHPEVSLELKAPAVCRGIPSSG